MDFDPVDNNDLERIKSDLSGENEIKSFFQRDNSDEEIVV